MKGAEAPKGDSGKGRALTYADALEAVAHARVLGIVPVMPTIPPFPDLQVDYITQVKLVAITMAMMVVGRGPGDFPVAKFDRPIEYRKLREKSQEWLEQCGIPARRSFAPLAAKGFYIWLFGNDDRLPVHEEDAGRFFGRLIHFLLIETQIITAKQYYHGLGLYEPGGDILSIPTLGDVFSSDTIQEIQLNRLLQAELDQMHGRIFVDYCAVMIRAQWDKLVRLSCLVFGLDLNWDSISKGLKALEQKRDSEGELHPWCRYHLQAFTEIAQERLAEGGWLRGFRDPLLHDVGPHSAGVVPHKKSLETTSEMWDKVCDEHDWLREATMAALVAFVSAKAPANTETHPPCYSEPISSPHDVDEANA